MYMREHWELYNDKVIEELLQQHSSGIIHQINTILAGELYKINKKISRMRPWLNSSVKEKTDSFNDRFLVTTSEICKLLVKFQHDGSNIWNIVPSDIEKSRF